MKQRIFQQYTIIFISLFRKLNRVNALLARRGGIERVE